MVPLRISRGAKMDPRISTFRPTGRQKGSKPNIGKRLGGDPAPNDPPNLISQLFWVPSAFLTIFGYMFDDVFCCFLHRLRDHATTRPRNTTANHNPGRRDARKRWNPHVAAGQRACLRTLWVPCLHLPFCMCLLRSTFCTPPCWLPSVGFLFCFLPKEIF